MWVICYKKKEKKLSFLYPDVLQVVCFWGQVVHIVKTMYASTNMRSKCRIFATEKKGWRQIGCKVNVKSGERKRKKTDLDQTQAANTFFVFCQKAQHLVHLWDLKLTSVHQTGVDAAEPPPIWLKQTKNYLQLVDTGLCKSEYKPLAVATSHVNHTHQAKTRHHHWLQDLNISFAVVQSIQAINILLLRIYWHQNIIYISVDEKKKTIIWFPL